MTVKKKSSKKSLNKWIRFADKERRFNVRIFAITMALLTLGLITLYSASYVVGIYRFKGDSLHYISSQLLYAAIGIFAMFAASKIDYRVLKNYSFSIFILTIALLFIALFMPEIKGVHRWIVIPKVISFQPSELAKFSLILTYAKLIEHNYEKMHTLQYGILPFMVILVMMVGLLFLEPHLSCIMIMVAVAAIMMFSGGSDIKYFAIGIALVLFAVVIVVVAFPKSVTYAQGRVTAWLHPEEDLAGKGYQTYNSLLAIGSGGIFGVGLGNGLQKHLHLPEPQNDFIFSVYCEELGLVGAVILICLFVALIVCCIYVAVKTKDIFGKMMVIGITSQIGIQAFFNMAVVTGTIPNTGISLPFFSEGGTSLVMLLAEVGIVLSVSRFMPQAKEPEEDI